MDKKGILTFLAIALAASYLTEAAIVFLKLPIPIWVLFVIPAPAAWIASRVSSNHSVAAYPLRHVPKIAAVRVAITIPLLFVVLYTITTLLGFSKPDWRAGELMAQLPSVHEMQLTGPIAALYPLIILVVGFVLSVILGPTLFALLLSGTEYGWRGYVLPRIATVGRWRSYILTGALWGATFAPIACYQANPGNRLPTLFLVLAAGIALTALLGEILRHSGHLGLTAVCCGCVVGQASTVWPVIFPAGSAITFPWGGSTGVIAIALCALTAFLLKPIFGTLRPLIETVNANPIVPDAQPQGE